MEVTEVLKILAEKVSGRATVVCLAMVLLSGMATEDTTLITSACIILLAIFYFIMQWILDKKEIDKKELSKEET